MHAIRPGWMNAKFETYVLLRSKASSVGKRLSGRTVPILYEDRPLPVLLTVNVRDFSLHGWKRH
ncbi:MAG: hypothetical protein ACI9BW_001797 [Gammaproteobacteria bacterium]|jgi:hypothetical protein